MNDRFRAIRRLASATLARWNEVEGLRLGAAFSFYAIFSIFPLLLVSVTVVGFLVGSDQTARVRLLSALSTPHSPIREVLDRTLAAMQASQSERGLSAIVGLGTLLVSASGAAVELHFAINRIWRVPPREPHGVVAIVRVFLLERLAGFAMIGGVAVTLLASLVVSAIIGVVTTTAHVDGLFRIGRWTERLVSFTLMATVVSAAFHLVPRTRPAWWRVVPGGIVTAALLNVLKSGFAIYLARIPSFSAYGLVGSVLALVTWIYASSQVFLFGATLTSVMSERAPRTASVPRPTPRAREAESIEESANS